MPAGPDEEDDPIDVLNLPQLYQRPSASGLLDVLADLSLVPLSWAGTTASTKRKIGDEGVPAYLTKIISSPLTWIEDDLEKEVIWETAAQRLSERSGRTGMGNISRVFSIPLGNHTAPDEGDANLPDNVAADREILDITLHEPALSEDNLGLKTWAASYLLAKRLPLLLTSLPPLAQSIDSQVLELGSGTGLVGLAAAAIFRTQVLLTDLPAIVPNLERNVQANETAVAAQGGTLQTAILDWTKPGEIVTDDTRADRQAHSFPLILAADPIYSSDHPALLVNAIAHHLNKDSDARVVIELPLRDRYARERQDLKDRLVGRGLQVTAEGEESGFDDWGAKTGHGGAEQLAEVTCWWSVWQWS